MNAEQAVREKWRLLAPTLDERTRRLWAGAEAGAIGYGGIAAVARATGLAISTVRRGRDEARTGAKCEDIVNVRRSSGTRSFEATHPEVWPALDNLVDPATRSDPEPPLQWTCKSTHALAAELLAQHGLRISDRTVAKLLRDHGYSLQAPNKAVEGAKHPDRNQQFEHINATAETCLDRGIPVISVNIQDEALSENFGDFGSGGRERRPEDEPEVVDLHDFPQDATPCGVQDAGTSDGFVSARIDHDAPVFAVMTIETWWEQVGSQRYSNAREIFVTANTGGSNGHCSRVWKYELQRLADKLDIAIRVSHFPPGTSKWNKVVHRLFSFISIRWRGRPLRTYKTFINLIAPTSNRGDLAVRARLGRREHPAGRKIPASELATLRIDPAPWHGDWNFLVTPRNEQR